MLAPVLLFALALAPGNRPLIDVVARAYDVPPHRILAPDWLREARYDIVPGTTGPALQKALEEKYAIVAGFQSRPVETWVLECPHPGRLIAADVIDETGMGGAFRFSLSWSAHSA